MTKTDKKFIEQVKIKLLARVVRDVDHAVHRINHYPADSVVCFVNTYRLDSDLSGGWRYPYSSNNWGLSFQVTPDSLKQHLKSPHAPAGCN